MFTNLDTIPVGQSLFTIHVTLDPEGTPRSQMTTEEYDITLRTELEWDVIAREALPELRDLYGNDYRVVGIVNQSAGYVVFDAFARGIETGANDL